MMTTLTGLCALMMLTIPVSTGGGEDKDVKSTKKPGDSIVLSGDRRLEILSTAEMTAGLLRNRYPWIGPVLQARFDRKSGYGYTGMAPIFSVGEWAQRISADDLVELLIDTAGVDRDVEGTDMESMGDQILIVSDQKTIDNVRAAYERLLATTAPRFEIRSVVFEVDPKSNGFSPGSLDPKAAAKLLGEVEQGRIERVLYQGRAMGRAGDSVRMGQAVKTDYVGDMEVEIAQKSAIGDPVIIPLDLERSLTLRPLLSPDGERFAVIGMFNSRQMDGGVESERVVAEGTQSVDQVRVELRQRVFSMSLADGSGYLLAPGGARQPGLRVFLQLRRLDPKPQEIQGLAMIPTALVASDALRARKAMERAPLWLSKKGLSSAKMVDYIESLAPVENGESQVRSLPEFLWIMGSAASDARRIVRKMSADAARSFVVEIRREIRPLEGVQQEWTAHGEAIRIPSLARRLGYAMTGYEQTYVGDYSVEVAQEAGIGKLQSSACFIGIQAWTAVIPSGRGATVHLDLRDSSLSDWRRVSAPTDVVGDITIPRIDEAHLLRKLELQVGETRSLGEGARRIVDGIPHRTRITLKLIER